MASNTVTNPLNSMSDDTYSLSRSKTAFYLSGFGPVERLYVDIPAPALTRYPPTMLASTHDLNTVVDLVPTLGSVADMSYVIRMRELLINPSLGTCEITPLFAKNSSTRPGHVLSLEESGRLILTGLDYTDISGRGYDSSAWLSETYYASTTVRVIIDWVVRDGKALDDIATLNNPPVVDLVPGEAVSMQRLIWNNGGYREVMRYTKQLPLTQVSPATDVTDLLPGGDFGTGNLAMSDIVPIDLYGAVCVLLDTGSYAWMPASSFRYDHPASFNAVLKADDTTGYMGLWCRRPTDVGAISSAFLTVEYLDLTRTPVVI